MYIYLCKNHHEHVDEIKVYNTSYKFDIPEPNEELYIFLSTGCYLKFVYKYDDNILCQDNDLNIYTISTKCISDTYYTKNEVTENIEATNQIPENELHLQWTSEHDNEVNDSPDSNVEENDNEEYEENNNEEYDSTDNDSSDNEVEENDNIDDSPDNDVDSIDNDEEN